MADTAPQAAEKVKDFVNNSETSPSTAIHDEINTTLRTNYFDGATAAQLATRTSSLLTAMESTGTAGARLFGDRPGWIYGTNENWDFNKLNQTTAPPGVRGDRGFGDNQVLSRAELNATIRNAATEPVDRLRAQYLLNNFSRIATPGQDVISQRNIRDFVARERGVAAPTNLTSNVESTINGHADRFARFTRGENPGDERALRDLLNSSTYRNNPGNLNALMSRMVANKTDGEFIRRFLTPEFNPSVSSLQRSDLQNIAAGKDPRSGVPVRDSNPMTRLAANLASRQYREIQMGTGAGGLTASDLTRYAARTPEIRTPDGVLNVPPGRIALPGGHVINAPGEMTIRQGPAGVVALGPRPEDRVDLDQLATRVGAELQKPESERDLSAFAPLNAIMRNEDYTRRFFSAMHNQGHLGKLIADQLTDQGWGTGERAWYNVPGHLYQLGRSIVGSVLSDRMQTWSLGHTQNSLAQVANDGSRDPLQRLAAKAAILQFQSIENSDGRDRNWGLWSNNTAITHTEINRYRDRNSALMSTATLTTDTTYGGDARMAVSPALQAATALADQIRTGNTTFSASNEATLATNAQILVNHNNDPQRLAALDQLASSMPTSVVARLGQRYMGALSQNTGRITADTLNGVANDPSADVNARLVAQMMLRKSTFNSAFNSGATGYQIDQNRLQRLANTNDGPLIPNQTLVSSDLLGADRQQLADQIVNFGNTEVQSTEALVTLLRTQGRWTQNNTKGEAQFVYQRGNQWYVGTAAMQRYANSNNTYSMTMFEQRAQIRDGQPVVDGSGRVQTEGPTTLAMLANVRFDSSLPPNDLTHRAQIDPQRSRRNNEQLSYRTPQWVRASTGQNVTGVYDASVVGNMVPGTTYTGDNIISPSAYVPTYTGNNVFTGDNTVSSGPAGDKLLSVAQMITGGLSNGATVTLDSGAQARVHYTSYPGRGGARNYEIRVTDTSGRVILRGIVDGGNRVRTVTGGW